MENYRDRIYSEYGKNFQDATAEFDLTLSEKWGRSLKHHLRDWLPANNDARIVDVACGGGKLLHFFVRRGYRHVEGVDISPDQVALSRQIVEKVTQENAIEFLKKNTNCFDLVTGFDIVEHFNKDDVLLFLDAAYASLKQGGRLILQTPNAESIWGAQHRYNCFTHEVGFNPNSLRRLLNLTGFKEIVARECDPPPFGYSIYSSIRFMLWQMIRIGLKGYNLVEIGSSGDCIFTRVFLMSGTK